MRLMSDEVLRKETGGFSGFCFACGQAGGSKATGLRHMQYYGHAGFVISW